MVDWVMEVLTLFEQENQTIFLTIHYLDLYLKFQKRPCSIRDLHLIGIVSIFIASKLIEVYPIKLYRVIEDIGKSKYQKDLILNVELNILQTIQFNTNWPTIHSYSSLLLRISGLNENQISKIEECSILLQKMFLYSYDILNVFSYHQLALYSIIISLKLFQSPDSNFKPQKIISALVKASEFPKVSILEDLNYLRNFARNFNKEYPFNKLDTTNSIFESQ